MKPLRSTYGPHHLLGSFPYVPAHSTSLAETFKRIRAQQEAERRERELREAEEREHADA